MTKTCSIYGCTAAVYGRGWCGSHYRRWYRHGDPMAGRVFEGETQRFLETAATDAGDSCLIWPYARTSSGYGNVSRGGKFFVASRVVCEIAHGPAPSDRHEAAHSCGRGHHGCVSGGHLRWALPVENQSDRKAHGTLLVGPRNPMAKLDEATVSRIRATSGKTNQQVADEYGVSERLVRLIRRGELWRAAHV